MNFIKIDKLLHFLVGYCLAATFYYSPITALACVVVVGASKEAYDFLANKYFGTTHGVELMDFLATIVGGVAGVATPFALKYVFEQFLSMLY